MVNPVTEKAPSAMEVEMGPLFVFWRTLTKNRRIVLAVIAACLGCATFITLGQRKIYRAESTLQVDPSPPKPLGRDVQSVVTMGADSFWSNHEYYETQYKIMQSRKIAELTVRSLGLQNDQGFLANLPPGQSMRGKPIKVTTTEAAIVLQSRLKVEPVKESRLVKLMIEDADPGRARKILSSLVNIYLEHNVDDVVASTGTASEWLHDQVDKLKVELEGSELALHEYKKDKRILSVSLDDQSSMLREEMVQLNRALTEVRTKRETLISRNRELEAVDTTDPVDVPASELLNNALLSALRTAYLAARSEEAGLLNSGKGENHPEVEAVHAKVEETRAALIKEIANIKGSAKRDLGAVGTEASGLSGLFEAAKQRAFDLNLLEIEYRRLERQKTNTEKLYSMVLERSKESDLTGMMRFNNIRVSEDAYVGPSPVKPRIAINLGIGLFAGVLLGLMAAVGREQFDRTLRNSDDVETLLKHPFLGALPQASLSNRRSSRRSRNAAQPLGSPELQTHEKPTGTLAEAARVVRTNLMFMSPDKPFKTLVVTSAMPSEGKTTVASSIAIAMAQSGQNVVLVDCDLRRPRLHRIYNVTSDIGVTNVTVDPTRLDEALSPTVVPNLTLLPAGPHVPNPAEILQSEAIGRLIKRLCEKFDRVVIDTPPVAIVSDSAILAARADGTVFVARMRKTQRESARKGLRALRDVGARVMGVVLNGLDVRNERYGYYYGYQYYGKYYGNQYGYGDESKGGTV